MHQRVQSTLFYHFFEYYAISCSSTLLRVQFQYQRRSVDGRCQHHEVPDIVSQRLLASQIPNQFLRDESPAATRVRAVLPISSAEVSDQDCEDASATRCTELSFRAPSHARAKQPTKAAHFARFALRYCHKFRARSAQKKCFRPSH